MVEARNSVRVIARTLGKTRDGVRMKIARLGLEVVVQPKTSERTTTTSEFASPKDLPSIEEALKTLNTALERLKTPGLEQSEVLRLRSIIQGVKIYQELFADYADYRGIETRLIELEAKYGVLTQKTKNSAPS
jgi:superfamily II RNA helicase